MVIERKQKPIVGRMKIKDKIFLLIPRWTDTKIVWLCPARLVYRRERSLDTINLIKGPTYKETWVLHSIFTGQKVKNNMAIYRLLYKIFGKKAEDN